MDKILFYGMNGDKLCFQHALMNALQLHEEGKTVRIIFEGLSVNLLVEFSGEINTLYRECLEAGLIAGICLGCSRALGVYDRLHDLGIPFLDDMYGHAGITPWLAEGFTVVTI